MIIRDYIHLGNNTPAPAVLFCSQESIMESQEKPDYTLGYFAFPRRLRAEIRNAGINVQRFVLFLVEETFGWDQSRWVFLTYDEIIHGRKKMNGERMGEGSGLPDDRAISRTLKAALDARIIEIWYTQYGTLYAIHRRFWLASKLTPRWIIFKRVPWDAARDPLEDSQVAGTMPAQQLEAPAESTGTLQTAGTMPATSAQDVSNLLAPGQQAAGDRLADLSQETAPQEVRGERKDTYLDTSKRETEDRYVAPSARSPAARPISVSKTEKEENEAPPAPEFPKREQAPLQAGEDSKNNDASQGRKEAPAPARTAEPETARQRQREAIDARRQAQEVERKARLEAERLASAAKEAEHRAVGKLQERYDALILAKQKTEPGSPAWQQAREELQEVKYQLAAYGWFCSL